MQKISATRRTESGKGSNRRLRAGGQIPAILYGHGVDDSVSLSIDPRALNKALDNPKGQNVLIEVDVEGDATHTVLVRELQREPVSRAVLHVDLVVPNLEQKRISTVPVEFTGKSVGVSLGGRLRTPCRELQVESLPQDIPSKISVDITTLEIGDQVTASQLTSGEGVSVMYDRDFVVVKVIKARGAKADEEVSASAGEDEG